MLKCRVLSPSLTKNSIFTA